MCYMCDMCTRHKQEYSSAQDHISSLIDSVAIGSPEPWEVSEPYTIGGLAGVYTCVSPFLYGSEWKVDIASAGASVSTILISPSTKSASSSPDYTGASGVSYSGLSGLDGLSMQIQANSTVDINSEWYNVRNSDNVLFVIISNAANAAFVNIVFRHKRNTRHERYTGTGVSR
jgi:hypothetical protein